ncbi:MAG: RNA polymerase-binding protein DksA [Gammaproteobacteria bacterium]
MATTKKSATKKKAVAKKAPAKKAPVKKAVTKKASAPKAAAKKAPAKKTASKQPAAAKKAATKKVEAKKPAVKKPAAAKPATQKAATPAKKSAAAKKSAPVKSTAGTTVVESILPYAETPGEDYMNDAQREHFRNILLAWKRELMEEVDRTVHHMQDEAANFPDPNDRATQESEFSMELRTRDRERKLIKKIDETLGKLDHDEYGYCESCGIEIGIRRLEARPTAALCIDCKTLDEIREKQMGG